MLPALPCLHADEALLVLDKPAGLLSVPGRGIVNQDCASARAQAQWPDALVVHRLDMATSGLLLMARGAAMRRTLGMAFELRRVHKRYIAVVAGHVAQDSGEIDQPLRTDWPNRPRQFITADGRPSLTRWRVLTRESDAQGRPQTRLELEPVTGRTHQLRVHLQSIGHAILGDPLYADAETQARSPRLLLHASELAIAHPVSGEPLHWHSPPAF
ncbi:MAG: RluA family pseudouridine synthase [Burkholderiaceae bacterium]|nr:RluA family pseudouridine synthase [Burkholderiaceae bacterium]